MIKEPIILITALADIVVVFGAARMGRDWLVSAIMANLVMFGLFAGVLINVFGMATNAGNVFFACSFLATHFLIERYGKDAAMHMIPLGVATAVFFACMLSVGIYYIGAITPGGPGQYLALAPRIFFAGMIAYIFSQHLNIVIFSALKTAWRGRLLWLRSVTANSLSQLVASLLFFTIAYFDLPAGALLQGVALGWLIKTAAVALGAPLLYLDRHTHTS